MGEGGVFELGNPDGRTAQAVLEIQVEGGGSKNRAFCHGGVDFFWNNPQDKHSLACGKYTLKNINRELKQRHS